MRPARDNMLNTTLNVNSIGGAIKLPYMANAYAYSRRKTREVMVGKVGVGGDNPISVQSMTTTLTKDVEATVAQTLRLMDGGLRDREHHHAERRRRTRAWRGQAAAAGRWASTCRWWPISISARRRRWRPRCTPTRCGSTRATSPTQKRFGVREYSDAQYAAELERIDEKFTPVVLRCQERGVAMRIGTNHGSLSDRIMNRFGDTPEGMVESALEFVRICRKYDFHDIIFSMKASNPKVMIQAYRLLVARMDALGLDYPLHLGVTEAGNGEDGRIKSCDRHRRAAGRWPGRHGPRVADRGPGRGNTCGVCHSQALQRATELTTDDGRSDDGCGGFAGFARSLLIMCRGRRTKWPTAL